MKGFGETTMTVGTNGIRAATASGVALLMALMMAACGGDGSVALPSPTRSPTASLPSPTRSPSRAETQTPTPSEAPSDSESPPETSEPPSRSPSERPSSSEPSETATPEVSDSASDTPTPSETPTPTATPTPSPSPTDEAEQASGTEQAADEPTPSWVWWALAGLGVLAAALAVVLVARARRRSAWDAELASAEDEAAWLAGELLPQLQQSVSLDAVAGGWQVAAGRVVLAEDQLTTLESSAPDEVRGTRARALRDAVRAARQGVENLLASRDAAALPRDLASIATRLAEVLNPSPPTP